MQIAPNGGGCSMLACERCCLQFLPSKLSCGDNGISDRDKVTFSFIGTLLTVRGTAAFRQDLVVLRT
jgi:hypothetical protein